MPVTEAGRRRAPRPAAERAHVPRPRAALAPGSRRRRRAQERISAATACSTSAAAASRTSPFFEPYAASTSASTVENPRGRAGGLGRGDAGRGRELRRRPLHAGARARDGSRRSRCASCAASPRPAAACSPRRTACRSTTRRRPTTGAGRTPGSSGCSRDNGDWASVTVTPGAGAATACIAMLVAIYVDLLPAARTLRAARASRSSRRSTPLGEALDRARRRSLREPRPGTLFANYHVVAEKPE